MVIKAGAVWLENVRCSDHPLMMGMYSPPYSLGMKKITAKETPHPGTPVARRFGCTCSTWDNNENIQLVPGKGLKPSVNDFCPIHGEGTEYHAEYLKKWE